MLVFIQSQQPMIVSPLACYNACQGETKNLVSLLD